MAVAGRRGSWIRSLLRRQSLLIVAAVLVLGVTTTAVPLPGLLLEAPGRGVDVVGRLELPHPDTIDGDYLFGTVSLGSASVVEWLWARTTPHARIRPRKTFIADGVDNATYFRDQRAVFAASASVAVAVGLQAAGMDVDPEDVAAGGARMAAVLPDGVGVVSGDMGGPSAGLLIALATYDLADPGDLAAGRRIAGTGSIAPDGTVGRVGAIPTKVRTALRARADVFVVHVSQAVEASAAAGDRLVVVGVETLEEALAALGG